MEHRSKGDDDLPALVSAHGGHSGEFCLHAENSLEEIIGAYLERRFRWVGITEHMPPVADRYLYPDERAAGLNADSLYRQFARYMETCRRLQAKYAGRLRILVGFETETCRGCFDFIRRLITAFGPDYFVGSVHHVDDLNFDFSKELYAKAAAKLGGIERLYCRYFDQQHAMIAALRPPVVGHFDLVRIHDPHYRDRFREPAIRGRIRRNLEQIRDLGLVLDVNCRALLKGAGEPYPAGPILEQARDLGIRVLPGDDSHGLSSVGYGLETAVRLIRDMGFDTSWPPPPPISP